jgi:hypothetical protein
MFSAKSTFLESLWNALADVEGNQLAGIFVLVMTSA